MNAKTARMIIAICDWMMGYHGKIVEDVIHGILLGVGTFSFLSFLFIYFS